LRLLGDGGRGFGAGDGGGVLGLREDLGAVAERGSVDVAAGVFAFAELRGGERADAVFEILKGAEVAAREVLRVLQGDDVFPAEFGVADEVAPHFRFDVQPLDGVPSEDVAGVGECYDVRVVGEDLVGDWIHHLTIIVLREVEFQ